MIFLHTGLPGAGKTLYTLWHLKQLAEKEKRQVYYFNIPDVKIPGWVEIDEDQFLKWYELPPNSIIVADECQRIFRPRGAGTKVPEHVSKLETHRHLGLDLYLITQHPGLIDLNVRKLVGTHRHIVRSFGAKHAVVHSWNQCKDNCDKSRRDSVKSQFRYPKEVFSWYKSAEVHTHKMSIPFRLIALLVIPFLIVGLVWYAYNGLTVDSVQKSQDAVNKQLGIPEGTPAGAPGAPSGGGRSSERRPLTVAEYIESQTPRIPELVYTAPRYDELTKPVDAPRPAACVFNHQSQTCRCIDQQGNRYAASQTFCRNVVDNGIFYDWQPLAVSSQLVQPGATRSK